MRNIIQQILGVYTPLNTENNLSSIDMEYIIGAILFIIAFTFALKMLIVLFKGR